MTTRAPWRIRWPDGRIVEYEYKPEPGVKYPKGSAIQAPGQVGWTPLEGGR